MSARVGPRGNCQFLVRAHVDSVGVAGCRIQTTVAPLGGMTFVTILYAADCPIG